MKLRAYCLSALICLALLGCEKGVDEKTDRQTSETQLASTDETALTKGNSEADLRNRLAGARKKLDDAEQRGFAWTGTADLLEQVTLALEQNDLARAEELTNALLVQAEALVEQANRSDAYEAENTSS